MADTTQAAKAGIGFGSALAITISWSQQVRSLGLHPRRAVLVLRRLLPAEAPVAAPGPASQSWSSSGRVIVPEATITAPALRLTSPVPLPVAPSNRPVPSTILCVISRNPVESP
jgi:hypothetical protein